MLLRLALTAVETVVGVGRMGGLSGILRTGKETDNLLPRCKIGRNRRHVHVGL